MGKKISIVIATALALCVLLVSCGGGGGGGGGGAGPSTVAKFVSSMNEDFVFVFNSGGSCLATGSCNGVALEVENFTWSYQNGDFNNGTLNFNGARNSTITITNGTFNYTPDGGVGSPFPMAKAATSTGLATFNGTRNLGATLVVSFKSDNTCTLSGTGLLSGISETCSYSITSGDFNNGVVDVDGDTFTITNGSFTLSDTVDDVNGNPANLTFTFTKQ